MRDRPFRAVILASSLALSFAAFGQVLTAGFTADDWNFVALVHDAANPLVAIRPLAGRFLRPLVVLSYYVPYRLFGLTTWPYHALLVGIHGLNTFMVFLLARRIATPGERLRPALAALVFALMAPHSEAIAWFASIADPLATGFMLAALLAFGRALQDERPAAWIATMCGLFVLALASKETAMIFPALVFAYGALAPEAAHLKVCPATVTTPEPASEDRVSYARTVRLTLVSAAVPAVLVAGYLLLRAPIFGPPFAAYAGFGRSSGVFWQQARAFTLRAFLPPGEILSRWWMNAQDVYLFAAGAIALAFAALSRRERRAVLFLAAAVVIALGPALPLSISVSNTVSERFVYTATVFSSILVVWIVWRLVPRRAIATAAVVLFAALHARVLWSSNQTWADAAALFDRGLESVIARVREDGAARDRPIHILTMPDNLRGAFVFRNGFYDAMRLRAPGIAAPERRIFGATSHDTADPDDAIQVARVGPAAFSIDLGRNRFVQSAAPDRPPYHFRTWSREGCTVELTDARGLVLYFTRGAVAFGADLDAR